MPRLSTPLLTNKLWGFNTWKKNFRHPADPKRKPLRFTEVAPMKLRNHVVGKGTGNTEQSCLPETMALFECMAAHDNDPKHCPDLVKKFQDSYETYLAKRVAKKTDVTLSRPVPGAKKLTNKQLNVLLQRFPQPFDK